MKLRLSLDGLRVEAFETGDAGAAARGTVHTRESAFTLEPCPRTGDDTCGMTCGPTCPPPSCSPDTVCGCA